MYINNFIQIIIFVSSHYSVLHELLGLHRILSSSYLYYEFYGTIVILVLKFCEIFLITKCYTQLRILILIYRFIVLLNYALQSKDLKITESNFCLQQIS